MLRITKLYLILVWTLFQLWERFGEYYFLPLPYISSDIIRNDFIIVILIGTNLTKGLIKLDTVKLIVSFIAEIQALLILDLKEE